MKLKVPCCKLGSKQAGPFKVERQIDPSAYWLDLPLAFKIFQTFHECLLTPFKAMETLLPNPFLWKENLNLIQEFYKRNPTAVGHPELTLAAMKLLLAHKNFSLSHLPDDGIVPRAKAEGNITVGSIMPGIIWSSRKA
ncbi:hypothetical protein DSO57_1001245 [Entomophthora muscae]|uniref:Uncharacterized protein n=1 Tax=Entomophthora muscae TaxID=34485 RepID=A0ACC2SLW3_9FUNG|nr:hypothetical protein DSO57_1001245 [Entomophthora muscae]